MKMTVVRLETPDGQGPYNNRFDPFRFLDSEFSPSQHVPPKNDPVFSKHCNIKGSWTLKTHYFGFTDIPKLIDWFDVPLDALEEFVISLYEIEPKHVIISGNQLAFWKERAVLVNTLDIPTIYGFYRSL